MRKEAELIHDLYGHTSSVWAKLMCDPHYLEEVEEQGIMEDFCWVAGTILPLGVGRELG